MRRLALLLLCFATSTCVDAAGFKGDKADQVKLERWQCAFCPFQQTPNSVTFNLRHLPKQAQQLRNQLGQQSQTDVGLSAQWRKTSEQSGQWQAQTTQLGFDSFSAKARWRGDSQQQIAISYRQLSQNLSTMQTSPYGGWSSGQVSLPDNWQPQDQQQNFDRNDWQQPRLDGLVWRQLMLDASYPISERLLLSLQWQQQQREGYRPIAVNQLVQSTQLMSPVDEKWQKLALDLDLDFTQWDAGINYQRHRFDNKLTTFGYDYAFVGFANLTRGESALAPDSEGNVVSGYFRLPLERGNFYLTAGVSEHSQQQTLLPYSTNSELDSSLPQPTWHADTQVRWSKLRAQHWLNSKTRLQFNYQWQSQQLEAPQVIWQPVINDVYRAEEQPNPYYDRQFGRLELLMRWRSDSGNQLTTGYRSHHKHWDWTEQSNKAYQQDYFTSFHGKVGKSSRYDFSLTHSDQQSSSSIPDRFSGLVTHFYPMLSKQSDRLSVRLHSPLTSRIALSWHGFGQHTDFDNLYFGLESQRSVGLGSEIGWQLADNMQVEGSANWSQHRSVNALTAPGNFYQTDSTTRYWRFAWQHQDLFDKRFDWGLSFERNLSRQELDIAMATVSDSWSPYQGSWYSLALNSGYSLSRKQQLQVTLRHDKAYHYSWQQDLNYSNQINDLIALDSSNQAYRITLLQLSWRYQW